MSKPNKIDSRAPFSISAGRSPSVATSIRLSPRWKSSPRSRKYLSALGQKKSLQRYRRQRSGRLKDLVRPLRSRPKQSTTLGSGAAPPDFIRFAVETHDNGSSQANS